MTARSEEEEKEDLGSEAKGSIQEDVSAASEPRVVVRGLLLGQLLSLTMALMAVASKLLVERWAFSTPALQNSLGYFSLAALTAVPYIAARKTLVDPSPETLRSRRAALLFIALADSQSSYFGNLAFRYKVTVSSSGMLGSFAIPCVMMLSFIFLGARYRKRQIFGILLALFGLACVFVSDAAATTEIASPAATGTAPGTTSVTTPAAQVSHPSVVGDTFVILGAAIYAVVTVMSEGYVKSQELYEYLFWMGAFGFIISLIQFLFSELPLKMAPRREISHVEATFVVYSVLFALFYFIAGKFLVAYDAVAFNLSLLTKGLWGMLFGIFVFGESLPMLKLIGYLGVVVGISLYHSMIHVLRHGGGLSLTRGHRRSSYGSIPSNA